MAEKKIKEKKPEGKKMEKKPDAIKQKKNKEMKKQEVLEATKLLQNPRGFHPLQKMKEVAYEGQPYETIKFVLMTEKAVRFIETQNRLMFVVDRKADKKQIKAAVEAAFKTKTSGVNVLIDRKGRKRAFVKFTKPGEASEIAIRLGII